MSTNQERPVVQVSRRGINAFVAVFIIAAVVVVGSMVASRLASSLDAPATEEVAVAEEAAPVVDSGTVEESQSEPSASETITLDPNPELVIENSELEEENQRLTEQIDLLTSDNPDLITAVESLRFPGLVTLLPENAGDPALRFDDPELMTPRVWVTENNEACDQWVSSYTVLNGDAEQFLRDCTEWQVPPGETLDFEFVAQSGTYWNTTLDMLVTHDPVLAARMEGQPGREPMPWLAITPVTGITLEVWYDDGTYCPAAETAVIATDMPMRVRMTNTGDTIFAKLGIGPGGDPNMDINLEAWTIGNDVPLPECHPADWTPGS